MTISIPTKTTVPFAASGDKNSIPVPSQSGGIASFTAGFPPLTMTPKASGGVPPSGKDMNGILFNLSQAIQYEQSGGHFPYDNSFASAVGGYPIGAIVQSTDNTGFWINGTANNSTDPESFGAGWLPLKQTGATLLSVASTNITLTALQAAKDTFIISGSLTSNINIIVPTWTKSWSVVNNATTGAYSITIKTASGTGAILLSGANEVIGDGVNVLSLTYLLATRSYVDNSISALDFTNSKTSNGYQKLPNGLILQWGNFATGGTTITFPIAFPNNCLMAAGSARNGDSSTTNTVTLSISATNVIFQATPTGTDKSYWIAIGY